MKRKPIPIPAGAHVFEVPVYGGRVALCLTREAYNKVSKAIDGTEYKQIHACRGVTQRMRDGNNSTVYMLGVFEDHDQTLVHELAHMTFAILAHAGVPINLKNDEAFAYLIDELYAKAREGIRKIRRRKAR